MTRTLFTLLFVIVSVNSALSVPNYIRESRQAADEVARELGDARDFDDEQQPLGLPSKSTSIRSNIVDTFSCAGKQYGYYADVDNECQVFHVCLPVVFADETEKMYKWSFICPAETIFNQESFTCARAEDSVPCQEAATFYSLNDNFGKIPEKQVQRGE